jgi:hypothetical protein
MPVVLIYMAEDSPHCCRHTYISNLEDKGVDLAVIQTLSGQSTQAAMISYIHAQSPSIVVAASNIDALQTSGKNPVGTHKPTYSKKSEKKNVPNP